MKFSFDTTDLKKLEAGLKRYGSIMSEDKAKSALQKAARPMLAKAKAEVPVSMDGRMRTSLRHGRRNKNADAYSQGGATRRDLRIKGVNAGPNELTRVLVGVSKKASKVGWRTVFITKGTKVRQTKRGANRGRMIANNFLQRAFDGTIDGVRADFQKKYREAFVSWARQTLPQITR